MAELGFGVLAMGGILVGLLKVVLCILVLVVIWRTMRAHESISQSLGDMAATYRGKVQ
jgi:hypothetical protein